MAYITFQRPDGYTELPGLEGPFYYPSIVLYYDPKAGKYWNPKTDFYLSHDEKAAHDAEIQRLLNNAKH